jgi:predicted ATPase
VEERRLLKLLSSDLTKRHGLVLESSVKRRGRQILAHYRFAHALVQQYLYGSLSDAEKMLRHGDVAALLEEVYEGGTNQIATDLAITTIRPATRRKRCCIWKKCWSSRCE